MSVRPTPSNPNLDKVPDLIAACLAGDDVAQGLFIVRYGELILRAVARQLAALGPSTPLRGDAEDIRNDLLTRLLEDKARRLAGLRDASAIDAWLVSVARNHTVDYARRQSRRMRAHEELAQAPPPPTPPDPSERAIQNESAEIVHAAIRELPAEDRLFLALYYQQGLKYAEIAAITGRNINTVASRLHRARTRLRDIMEKTDALAPPIRNQKR